ncbi:MAG: hypothetical protein C5B59_18415 [Bacteroidetes bacterium]|nr:MAG: hypothetical protein C5B59_18415 [Bacteroidota bacterium]
MAIGAEYFNPYDQIGLLHNEGINYVNQKLNSANVVTRQNILEFVAEFMFYIDCCDLQLPDFSKTGFIRSKIRYTLFLEFLVNLQNYLQAMSVTDLAKQAEIKSELLPIVDMIFHNASSIEEDATNSTPGSMEPIFQMLDYLEQKAFENTDLNQKRSVGLLTAICRSSIEYGQNVLKDPKLRTMHENVNLKAVENVKLPENEKKKFRWSFKADVEGGLGGLITGGVGGFSDGQLKSAAIGGILGAVGGAISNSFIRSIPAFSSNG